jgi:hypothetical protein
VRRVALQRRERALRLLGEAVELDAVEAAHDHAQLVEAREPHRVAPHAPARLGHAEEQQPVEAAADRNERVARRVKLLHVGAAKRQPALLGRRRVQLAARRARVDTLQEQAHVSLRDPQVAQVTLNVVPCAQGKHRHRDQNAECEPARIGDKHAEREAIGAAKARSLPRHAHVARVAKLQ